MSCYWSSRGSLEIGPITIKRSTRDDGFPAPAKESEITRLCCSLTLSNKLENLASNRPFWEEEDVASYFLYVHKYDMFVQYVCEYTPLSTNDGLRLRCWHHAISGVGISCRPSSEVKGVARQLVKRIIPAYVTRPKLMSHALLNHSRNRRGTVCCRMP